MIKNNKFKIIISSIITLLPMLFGIIVYDKLPDYIATHWGIGGEADGFSSKAFAVFLLPIIFFAIFWLCIFATTKDPKNKNQNSKPINVVIFIIPAISCLFNAITYIVALGYEIDFKVIIAIVLGLMFIFIGNYLPKCKQNYTLGIKIKWTLRNEENWNATHRFTGKVWLISGILMILCIFLPDKIFVGFLPILIIPVAVLPPVFSYSYYKKQLKNGTLTNNSSELPKYFKLTGVIATIIIVLLLIFLSVVMFTGDINYEFGDTSFTINADYYDDITVDYSEIENIELRESCDIGEKFFGFNSARLLMGGFKNDEFSKYTRYTYRKTDASVVITDGEKYLVINGIDDTQTKEIYNKLSEKLEVVTK